MAKAILYPMRARKVSLKPVRNTPWIIYLFTEAKNLVKLAPAEASKKAT